MAFIGTPLDTRNTFQSLVGKRFNGDGSTTAFTLDVAPSSTLDIEVFVGNVRQDPNSAYTLSGTTLTFTGAPPSGTNNIYVVHQAKAVGTIEIPATTGSEKTFTGGVVIADDSDGSNGLKIGTGDDFKIYHDGTHTYMDNNTGALFMRNNGSVIIEDLSGNNIIRGIDGGAVDLYHNGVAVLTTNANGFSIPGTTPTLTIGDAGAEDTKIVFDGNAQDYYIGLDDSADDLIIGKGSAVGTTPIISMIDTGETKITSTNSAATTPTLNVHSTGNANPAYANLKFTTAGNTTGAYIKGVQASSGNDGRLEFHTNNAGTLGEAVRVHYNKGFSVQTHGDTNLANNSDGALGFSIDYLGVLTQTASGRTPTFFNRQGDGGTIVSLNQAGNVIGTISASGTTISYNAFSGSHWSRLADNSLPTILRGTVMESISTMVDWYTVTFEIPSGEEGKPNIEKKEGILLPDGKSAGDVIKHTYNGVEYDATISKEENEQLPMCKISDTANSKAVYGVFCSWDNEPDDGVNDMLVTALGAFVVRIHKDETVAIGNWLVSKGDGTAKVLAGNTAITADVQSSLIGKVTSTEKTHEYADGSYCVPCTLHCG